MTSPPRITELDVTRRGFLRAGSAGVVGLSLGDQAAFGRGLAHQRHVIFILMAGGASQLETFDPKPQAPSHIRGPMRAIPTSVPGVWLNESLPKLAARADRFALIRSLTHDYAPIHETGQQLLQCGRLMEAGVRFPHFGAIVAKSAFRKSKHPANVVLPRLLNDTGTHPHRGQTAGGWGTEWDPVEVTTVPKPEPEAVRRSYGETHFGRLLLQARQLVEQGTQCVTVNLFDTLHGRVTWDCHGDVNCAPGTVCDYRDTLCPQFDQALSALLDDLARRELLNDTLIVATGEFGRTPRLNDHAGRDHWPGCWSALVAGGGVTGGAVLGASDDTASMPIDRPVSPAEITATLLGWFGIDGRGYEVAIGNKAEALIPAEPLRELWG